MNRDGEGSRKEWWRRTGTRNWQASTCVNDTKPLRPSSLVTLCRHSINAKARPSPILPVIRHRAPVEPVKGYHEDEFSLSYDQIYFIRQIHPAYRFAVCVTVARDSEGAEQSFFGFSFRRASIYPYGTELWREMRVCRPQTDRLIPSEAIPQIPPIFSSIHNLERMLRWGI